MYVNDPIADMLTRIRNAIMARKTVVEIPHSKMKVELARVLLEEGYIENYSVREDNPFSWIVVKLKFVGERRDRRSVISGLKRVSKPGRRIYTGYQDIPWVLSGMGIAVLTTPKGVMTGQRARKERVGGEVLCYIW
ncbi:MAG: 30S ribosomal protein S8 [Anaerolineae bacterium]|nr:30S ribosomal protein S8 [Anaerolineae bacterium]